MRRSSALHEILSDIVWYIFTIIFCITLVSTAGFFLIRQQKQFLLIEKQNEISTIADIKKSLLVQWRKELLAEAASIRANAMMAHRINDFISGKDPVAIHKELKQWMQNLIEFGGYSRGILCKTDGEVIASDSELKTPPEKHYLDHVAEVVQKQEVLFTDYHSDVPGDPYDLDLVIPIMYFDGMRSRCIAVLTLDIEPTKGLNQLIQSWPTSSSTAETLLVKREGDTVLFLNELRHRKNTATPFQLPLSKKNLPAVQAALGQEGSFEGIDYRNEAVLCATRVIPGTRWGIVAKIDVSEILTPLSKSILYIVLSGAFVAAAIILGVFLWGQRKKAEILRKEVDIEHKHNLELKKAEDSLTQSRDYHIKLLDVFPVLVWRSGTDAQCNYFNQTWLTFTGRTLDQELGDGWTDGVHTDDLEHCITIYKEAFHVRRPFKMDYRLRFNDGSYHWINDHGSPFKDQNGAFAGYIGSCYDINDQKNAEFELQRIHEELEQQVLERTNDLSDINSLLRQEMHEREQLEQRLLSAKRLEAIGQIAGGVAHEVRNPLNAILTITEALFREEEIASNSQFEPFIMHIRTQVNRLVHLMNDLLDLGRSIPATNLQPTPLYKVCRETVELWKSTGLSRNKRAVLASDGDDISSMVLADALKLQQVIFNLLENAGHHSQDDNKIVLRLMNHELNLTEGMAVIQVFDMGNGIPEEKLSHVFDPFYTDRKGGTGLGLALVKHFTENMGGTVQIWNNNPPPGCTVEVRIPYYREELQ
jgi:PAS domain S-box-containing protein